MPLRPRSRPGGRPVSRTLGTPPSLLAPTLLAALVLASGCDVPRFEGAQIQRPPPGFTLQPESTLERRIFPDRTVAAHQTWVRSHWGDFSGIYIQAHRGATTREEVESAWQASLTSPGVRWDEEREVGGLERLTIDGRDATGWLETVRGPAGGIAWVSYRAVIPYDTVSYAVEFLSGDPTFKSHPDSLRTIVASFAVGRVRFHLPLILLASGGLLFLLSRWQSRSRERDLRARAMVLPRIERPAGAGDAEEAAPVARPTAPGAQRNPPDPS
jgi:hypothetical protein